MMRHNIAHPNTHIRFYYLPVYPNICSAAGGSVMLHIFTVKAIMIDYFNTALYIITILLTGNTVTQSAVSGKTVAHLSKPFSHNQLIHLVQKGLQTSTVAAQR